MATYDRYPIVEGHSLIIPKRHISSYFDLNPNEHQELQEVLHQLKTLLKREYQPDGYNIGINDGAAAGQTINHLHIHIIPRHKGDHEDPRGGIRLIFPDKAKYWD